MKLTSPVFPIALILPFAFLMSACSPKAEPAEKAVIDAADLADKVVIATSAGDITVELDGEKAPITVANFLAYAKAGHYDGTLFHRVIDGFMIQGGGFAEGDPPVEKPTKDPIKNERDNGLKNKKLTLAMARTNDLDSATSQFFVNLVDNESLDHPEGSYGGYAVFGKVVGGQEVVEKIGKMATENKPLSMRGFGGKTMTRPTSDVPVEPVVIKSVKVAE